MKMNVCAFEYVMSYTFKGEKANVNPSQNDHRLSWKGAKVSRIFWPLFSHLPFIHSFFILSLPPSSLIILPLLVVTGADGVSFLMPFFLALASSSSSFFSGYFLLLVQVNYFLSLHGSPSSHQVYIKLIFRTTS